MQFQPKIIIGSVFGIATTIISVIAIFFPSVFNFEKNNVDSFEIDLAPTDVLFNSKDTYLQLYNFLYNHQNKVVKLTIFYNEYFREYILEPDDILNRDKHLILGNTNDIKGVYGYADLDDLNGIVLSSFYQGNVISNIEFYRSEGSIGLYYYDKNKNSKLAYILSIPYNSDFNNTYKWSAIDIKRKYKMELSGIFYINKFTKEKYYVGGPRKLILPTSFLQSEYENGTFDDLEIEIITLQPISNRDFASKKY